MARSPLKIKIYAKDDVSTPISQFPKGEIIIIRTTLIRMSIISTSLTVPA